MKAQMIGRPLIGIGRVDTMMEEKKMFNRGSIAFLVVGWLVVAGTVSATPIGFQCITNNSATNAAIGETQLTLDGMALGGGYIGLFLENKGSSPCSITDVYFDNGGSSSCFDNIAGLWDRDDPVFGISRHPGVDFSMGAAPPNLPGGNTVGFNVTSGFAADSDDPRPVGNGVNPGEFLGIVIRLIPGKTLADVWDAFESGEMRVGIHVQAFADGGSESFVTGGVGGEIPEPTTVALLGAGVLSLAMRNKRRH